MASRSQIRLQQLTGSLSDPGSLQSKHSLSGYVAEDLKGVLDAMGESIARIHGESDFTNQDPGYFSHAITGSAGLQIAGDADFNSSADIQGAANLQSSLDVAGLATFTGDADFNGTNVGFSATVDSNFIPDGPGTRDLGAGGAEWNAYIDALDASSAVLGTAKVSDLTDNRIVIAGASGELEDDANFTMDGTTFTAAIAVDFSQTGGSTSAANFDVAGYAQFAGAVEVDGGLIANSAQVEDLTAIAGAIVIHNGSGELEDSIDLYYNTGTDTLHAISASFSKDVQIGGNLTVLGSTTTVNTEEVTIADHNIILDSNNSLGAVIDGAGITIEGGSGDDLTFQWLAADTRMELKLGSNYADLKVRDMIADRNIQGVTGSFQHLDVSADADLLGESRISDAVMATAKVSDLTSGRIVLAGTAGELQDDGDFTYNATDIMVGGAGAVVLSSADDSVEADIFKVVDSDAQLSIASGRYGGTDALLIKNADAIALKADADFIGFESSTQLELGLDMAAADEARFLFNDGSTEAFKVDSANSAIQVSLAIPLEFRDADLSINSSTDGQLDIDADVEIEIAAPTIDMNGNAKISGDVWLDGASKDLRFYDAASAYVGFKAPTVASGGSVVWSLPTADASGADYALVSDGAGALSWKAPAQASSKKYIIEDGAVSSHTSLTTTVDLSAITLARAVHVLDVYVNGQLMKPDLSGGAFAAYSGNVASTADYKLDMSTDTASKIKFGFALEADDVVTVIMRA